MRSSTFLFALLPLALASPRPRQEQESDWSSLSSLLDSIDNTVLHGVLHQLSPKYKDGIFQQDRHAIEHVHSSSPIMATKLVHMALKRQDNSTIPATSEEPTSTAPTTSNEPTTSEEPTSAPAPTTSETPADSTEAASISSALSEDITASTTPDPTTVAVAPSTPPNANPVSTVEGGVVFSTIGGGVVTATSRNVEVSFTRSSSTRTVLSTAADGRIETMTSVIVVNAPVTGSPDSDAAGAAATTGNPGLQDGAVTESARIGVVLLAGLAAGVAAVAF